MSPEQLATLQRLSRMFEEGIAGSEEIKQLSDLLSVINHYQDPLEEQEATSFNSLMEQI